MENLGEARSAAGETVNHIRFEESDDVAAAGLANQWRERPRTGLDDGSLTPGTFVEVNGQLAFGRAQFRQDALDGLEFGYVDSRRQARQERLFGPVDYGVRKVVSQCADDTRTVRRGEEDRAAAASGDVGAVNEIPVVQRVNAADASGAKGQGGLEVVEGWKTEPADFDAFGDLGALGWADEVNAGLRQ